MKNKFLLLLGAVALLSALSCKKEGVDIDYHYYPKEDYALMAQYLDLPEVPMAYENDFPNYYSSSNRTYDRDMATLGRVLFYDKKLSDDQTISCASCHKQAIGFSDDVAFSDGVNGRKTARNSLALGSVFSFNEYYGAAIVGRVPFFWDNRASSVQEQSKATLANPDEMNMDMHQVLDRVREQPYYKPLFKAAYGHDAQSEDDILNAIGIFVNSIGSFNSKYDQAVDKYLSSNGSLFGIGNTDLSGLTAQENVGRKLYINNCSSCHGNIEEGLAAPALIQANNGLEVNYTDDGMGQGMFKVPTLRNVAQTGPYMHDGQLATLEDVVNHYSDNIQAHPNLNSELRTGNGQPKRMNFDASEKEALIAFLKTYTDEEFLNDPKYADPFK